MRRASILLGIGLLVCSVVLGLFTGRKRAIDVRDARLRSEALVETLNIHSYFTRSQSIVRILAQNPDLVELVDHPSDIARSKVSKYLAYLETLYPGQISETCLILSDGREVARVTKNVAAEQQELSPDESSAVFFAPTFASEFNQVYQSPPYRSEDTKRWVVANSVLVPTLDNQKRALVHFEVTIATTFGASLGAGGGHIRVVDDRGQVLIDSKNRAPRDESTSPLGHHNQHQFEKTIRTLTGSGVVERTINGERVAIRAVEPIKGNQNRWFVIASAPAKVSWTVGIGPASLLLLLAAVGVLFLAGKSERSHQHALREMSLTDDLTKLANRVLFRDRFDQAVRIARRDKRQVAILMLDLDEFKSVNDTLGHHHGDRLLQFVAERLRGVVREMDTLARLGGDEFAILMPDVDGISGAIALAERINGVLNENYSLADVPVHVGASIGISVYPSHGETIEELMQHADVAMYRAKNTGIEYAVYSTSDNEYSSRQLQLIAELRDAVYGEQLELHYQPKFDLVSERLVGVEALVRWRHPEFGLISPVEFIGAAERTGLIRQLTKWVMKTGLAQLAVWLEQGAEMTLAINLSPRSLTDQSVLDDVRSALTEAQIHARYLVLEVTETSFIADPERSVESLRELQALGLSVSIDDFGTGYSSLTYLRNLPVNEVKIDKSFVNGITTNSADASIVESTIDLAHALGFVVVAEGIEDQATLDHLQRLGCDTAQGYHLGRPQLAADLEEMIALGVSSHV